MSPADPSSALVVGSDQHGAAREPKRAGQDQRGTEGVRIVDREKMCRALVRSAATGIRQILEAVVGSIGLRSCEYLPLSRFFSLKR